ncbi:prolipoprotein diacylglyceryl transferase [Fervidobacterium sp. 2310opik-2]|uniref:prolipoprotein diacylglyceryl transferase n=1 Tax=Fervidobacterium sp. 2310opik-2 TaxID=1755815 RepID=UPI0016AEFB9A|nr:prolipoprotein diacylglyceryl transferase [Fervidobacterium sp. 2310opik-2]KAF2960879.1 prolipoprotein diacylglyceryl transferase [Fervidobacterium sp. 2310opik-2]
MGKRFKKKEEPKLSKSKRIILSVVIILAVGIGLFFFLREVFSGRLIVRDYIFQIGKFQLRWYSICIASGILVAYVLARRRLSMYPIKPEDLDEGLFWGIVAGILGARIYYVIFNWNYYSKYPSEIYKIWHGGLAIHGGIFGALLMIFIYSKIKGYFKFVHATDLFTSVLPLAQAIGRWGNFFNYEAYGRPTTLPWKMYVPPERRMPGFDIDRFFHPTFLYESLWDITIFVFLYFFVEKRKREYGETTALYLILYSLGRFWIESLRLDSLMAGHFRAAQVVSIILIFIGAAWYAYIIGKTGKRGN